MNILFTLHNIACKGGSERVVINLANELCQFANLKVNIVSYYTDTTAKEPYAYHLDSRVNVSYLYNHDEINKKGINRIVWRWIKPLLVNLLINKTYKNYDIIIESDFSFFYPRFRTKNTKYIKIMHSIINKWKSKNNYFDCIVFLNEKELLRWQTYGKNIIKIPNFIPSQPYINLLPKAINYLNELNKKDKELHHIIQDYYQIDYKNLPYSDIKEFKKARYILRYFASCIAKSERHKKNEEKYTLIAVGRMDAINNHKGFPRLIQAYSKIAHKFPSWRLEIIGQDQGQKKLLETQIKLLKMENYIFLKPFTTNTDLLYLEADIFVMSSHVESLPMVLIEAASFGLPIVAYDIGTIQDCFDKNGILVEDNNEQAFCLAMQTLMSDEEKRINMGWNGIRVVKERFSKEKIVEQWINLFQNISSIKE